MRHPDLVLVFSKIQIIVKSCEGCVRVCIPKRNLTLNYFQITKIFRFSRMDDRNLPTRPIP